ncbi:MAG: nucleoside recognition domain-containing protein [Clostridiales bacterium]|nr:nucleoside recognition domain-containing protein [Clostridiales bacterium]
MQFLLYLSNYMIPFVVLYVILLGLINKVPIFDEFVKGSKEGIRVVVEIMPTLIGLMVAVGVLRGSGALEAFAGWISPVMNVIHFPADLVPLTLVKLFSASAATSLLLDIYKQFGTDSELGLAASLFMSCSETIFYTMSVYFMAVQVKKTRWTLPGAFLATAAGIVASLLLAHGMVH